MTGHHRARTAARALIVWVVLLVVAVANGAIRQAWLVPLTGGLTGHQLSTLTLSAGIFLVAWLTIGWMGPATPAEARLIGLGWVALTLVFEFGAGRYAFGKTWPELLADYDVMSGRIWILVLATTSWSPSIAAALRLRPIHGAGVEPC